MARCLEQGSRLSAVRLARRLDADRLLGLGPFDEDDLYTNLGWLSVLPGGLTSPLHQREIDVKAVSLP